MAKKQQKRGRGRGNPPRKRVRRRPKKKVLALRIPVDEERLYDLVNSTGAGDQETAEDKEREAEDRDTFTTYLENLPSVPVDTNGRRM